MSKVVNIAYEYVMLSDVLQSTPWPAGYSPTLPSPPGVTPTNTTGITVPYSYQQSGTFAVGQSFTRQLASNPSATFTTFALPKYSNFYIYNNGATRVAVAPASWVVATYGPWPVISVEPGYISTWWQSMQGQAAYSANVSNAPVTFFIAYLINAAAPAVLPQATTPGPISLQIFSWVGTNND